MPLFDSLSSLFTTGFARSTMTENVTGVSSIASGVGASDAVKINTCLAAAHQSPCGSPVAQPNVASCSEHQDDYVYQSCSSKRSRGSRKALSRNCSTRKSVGCGSRRRSAWRRRSCSKRASWRKSRRGSWRRSRRGSCRRRSVSKKGRSQKRSGECAGLLRQLVSRGYALTQSRPRSRSRSRSRSTSTKKKSTSRKGSWARYLRRSNSRKSVRRSSRSRSVSRRVKRSTSRKTRRVVRSNSRRVTRKGSRSPVSKHKNDEYFFDEANKGVWGDPHYQVPIGGGKRIEYTHVGKIYDDYRVFVGDDITVDAKYFPWGTAGAQVLGVVRARTGAGHEILMDKDGNVRLDGKKVKEGETLKWKDVHGKTMRLDSIGGGVVELYTGEMSKVDKEIKPDRISIRAIKNATGNYVDVDPAGSFHSPPDASILGFVMRHKSFANIKPEKYNLKNMRVPGLPKSAK